MGVLTVLRGMLVLLAIQHPAEAFQLLRSPHSPMQLLHGGARPLPPFTCRQTARERLIVRMAESADLQSNGKAGAPGDNVLPEGLVEQRANFRRISLMLWRWSVASWWVQVVLATVSGVTLFFANAVTERVTVSAGPISNGLLFSSGGLMLAFVSIFWTWGYSRLATSIRLRAVDSANLPARVQKKLRVGTVINLLGMFLTLISAEQIVGLLIARVLSIQGVQSTLSSGALAQYGLASQAIRPLDIFIVQANTNTLVAHFVSLVTSLWLQSRLRASS